MFLQDLGNKGFFLRKAQAAYKIFFYYYFNELTACSMFAAEKM